MPHLANQFPVGSKIDIVVHSNKSGSEVVLLSKIVDAQSIAYFVTPPTTNGSEYPLRKDLEYSFIARSDRGVLKLPVTFLGNKREDSNTFSVFKVEGDPSRVQRRKHYRLEYPMHAKISLKEDTLTDDNARINNISGGGLQVLSKENFRVHDRIVCEFTLPEGGDIRIEGKVVWTSWNDTENMYALGVAFTKINMKQEDLIIAFIFQKQCELRQKGII